MGMGNAGSSYEYGGSASNIHSGKFHQAPNAASDVLTRLATTPPGNSQGMPYATSQAPYDSHRQMYSAPGSYSQPPYGQQPGMPRYGPMQTSPGGVKTEMGPPARAGAENEHPDSKAHDGYSGQQDAEGEHEGEYTHTSASNGARRASYNYKPNPAPGPLHSDPQHMSPHQNGSGRATPRTTNTYGGYDGTPQRPSQLPSSNLNYVMSNDTRAGAPNGQPDYGSQPGYQPAPQYPSMNGAITGTKRGRDDEEDPYGRPMSATGDAALKRQRTDPGAMAARPISQPQSAKVGGPVRR